MRRPTSVLTGPQIKGDTPMASRTAAFVMLMNSLEVLKLAAISGVAGNRAVLEKVVATVMKLVTKTITLFRNVDKLEYGTSISATVVELSLQKLGR